MLFDLKYYLYCFYLLFVVIVDLSQSIPASTPPFLLQFADQYLKSNTKMSDKKVDSGVGGSGPGAATEVLNPLHQISQILLND